MPMCEMSVTTSEMPLIKNIAQKRPKYLHNLFLQIKYNLIYDELFQTIVVQYFNMHIATELNRPK
jgi:hypothetical protein